VKRLPTLKHACTPRRGDDEDALVILTWKDWVKLHGPTPREDALMA